MPSGEIVIPQFIFTQIIKDIFRFIIATKEANFSDLQFVQTVLAGSVIFAREEDGRNLLRQLEGFQN